MDEAGQLGIRMMAAVFDTADTLDARVLLTRGPRRHGSVDRGGALKVIVPSQGGQR